MLTKKRPWERLEKEGDEPFQAFQVYLSLTPPRRIADAMPDSGKAYQTLLAYSSKYDWRARAEAYDARARRAADDATISEVERLAKEHVRNLSQARAVGVKRVEQLIKDVGQLSPREALAFVTECVKLERLIVGEATERIEQSWDTSKLTGEEAERLLELMDKMK